MIMVWSSDAGIRTPAYLRDFFDKTAPQKCLQVKCGALIEKGPGYAVDGGIRR